MHDALQEYLESLDRDKLYRVDKTIKVGEFEVTEVVFLRRSDGQEEGPFIRKRMKRDSGFGNVYKRIWEAQSNGACFTYLPRIIECYTTTDEQIVVMEFVYGETLSDAIYRLNPSVQLASDVFEKICHAVLELHSAFSPPIIHRDLKPSNIMLSSQGLKLIDFGIARTYNSDAATDTTHFGTRPYAPPEQFGFGQTDERSDIYAMGMLLHYCLTEKLPAASAAKSGYHSPMIPEPYRVIIAKATALDPDARYSSVSEMLREFQRARDSLMLDVPDNADRSREVKGFFDLPIWVGTVYNIFLLFIWILFMWATGALIADPTSVFAGMDLLQSIVLGYGVFGIGMGLLVYLLSDKRMIKSYVPFLRRFSFLQEFLFCVIGAFAVAFLSGFLASIL